MTEAIQRPPFRVSGLASIKHLNVRKEGPEDERILAVDVKLEFKGIDRSLCDYFDPSLQFFLWRIDCVETALFVRNDHLVPVAYTNKIENATVAIGGMLSMQGDLSKFTMEPRDGGVMVVTLSVSIRPNSQDVAYLAKCVQDDVSVTIESQPDMFAGTGASNEY